MDELEISGKRYISTKRAGKDHGYHSDYIGQLIRGKKVAGQKVGRAWYVDQVSLAEYLGKEAPAHAAQVVEEVTATPEPVVEEKVEEPEPIEEKIEEPVVVVEEEKITEPEVKIPEPEVATVEEKEIEDKTYEPVVVEEKTIHIKKYEPAVVQEKPLETADGYRVAIHTPVSKIGGLTYIEDSEPLLPRTGERAVIASMSQDDDVVVVESTPTKKFSFIKAGLVLIVGLVFFAGTAAACTVVTSHLVLEEGKTAIVNYGLNFQK